MTMAMVASLFDPPLLLRFPSASTFSFHDSRLVAFRRGRDARLRPD
jgi:hypothetical protein